LCVVKAKTQTHSTYVASQTAYCSCSDAVRHRQSRRTTRLQSKSRSRTLACNRTPIRSPSQPFNGLQPRNLCNFTDYCSFTDPGGMEGWVSPVGLLIADANKDWTSNANIKDAKLT